MTQENKVTTTRWTKLLAGFGAMAIVLAACGSSSGGASSSDEGTEAEAPENVTVADPTVTAGLT
jgi:ABC-type glycerol-3-phosphate transport system substrate-binding protein